MMVLALIFLKNKITPFKLILTVYPVSAQNLIVFASSSNDP
jgi:hypothetical protein